MRRTGSYITFFLLAVALLIPALYGVYLQGSRFLLKMQWQERLEQERQVIITLANDQIHWYEEGKEIILNDQLFDVRQITVGKDSTCITGLFDREESALQQSIENYFNCRDAEEDPRQYLGFLNYTFAESFPVRFNLAIPANLPVKNGIHPISMPLLPAQPVPTPPPDRCC